PKRVVVAETLEVPALSTFEAQLKGTGERENSTTMGFVRFLATLLRDKQIGPRVVPIVPDEARTFGMEGMFRQLGIYSSAGQLYEPEDSGEIAAYRESIDGQVLEEGINEAGAFSAWLAAATSYSTHQYTLIPFYIFYSMFGFQRIGDLAWAAGDSQARGFLLGGTAGRTTLNGEGLQHQDGHSHVLASTIPNCVAYDPCYTYELAVILREGLRRMIEERENVFYYVTVMNEGYRQPPMPDGVEADILKGMYLLETLEGDGPTVRLLGAGTILREVQAAARMLNEAHGLNVEVFSVTSFTEIAREARDVARWNLLHPEEQPRCSHVAELLAGDAPVIVSSDYIKALAEPLKSFIEADVHVLGTDGFGRSDTREALRHFFEVDRKFVALAALKSLADQQKLPLDTVVKARDGYEIHPDKANPRVS
ncbi:MAG: pyruvate dehydrogenase (acetyl-transferring), homodimeric type, partial [Gammaproteobacteria bacterium]